MLITKRLGARKPNQIPKVTMVRRQPPPPSYVTVSLRNRATACCGVDWPVLPTPPTIGVPWQKELVGSIPTRKIQSSRYFVTDNAVHARRTSICSLEAQIAVSA